MIRKAIIVMLSLLALWTTIESVLAANQMNWGRCPHPLLFEAGSWECGYATYEEVVSLGCMREGAPDQFSSSHGSLLGLFGYMSGVVSIISGGQQDFEVHQVFVQPWLVVSLLAAYPTIALVRRVRRRSRRRKRGLCPTCGYNLTGNTSGVCPECAAKVGR